MQRARDLAPALKWLGRFPLQPVNLLVLQLVVVYGARYQAHGFRPAYLADTRSYLDLAKAATLEEAMSAYRTYGYPLFLRLVGGGEVEVARVPEVQFALYSLAILLSWLSLRRYTGSGWLAFAGATPLAYASAMIVFLPGVLCMQLFEVWRRIMQGVLRAPQPG